MKIICFAVLMLIVSGCGNRPPRESMTSGTADIGCSDAVKEVAWQMSREFQMQSPQAFVDVHRLDTQALLDSLINGRAEEIFIDRTLTEAESLEFINHEWKLYIYPVGYYPVYLLVREENPVTKIDSTQLLGILSGTITNWRQLGGEDLTITPYIPLPGTGAWAALIEYFTSLDSVVALACSSDTRMLELALPDPGSLLVYSHPLESNTGYKKLRFERNGNPIAANVKSILEEPIYPFKLSLTYVTTHNKGDVAAGYLTFLVGDMGQRQIMKEGYRPAVAPVRVIKMR